jgi:hypothetical protein
MPQIEQILKFRHNLATPDQRREGDGFHDRKRPIDPAPVNLSPTAVTPTKDRSFVKCRVIERGPFQEGQTGGRSQNSLEIDNDPRKSDAAPPIKRRREIGIGKVS